MSVAGGEMLTDYEFWGEIQNQMVSAPPPSAPAEAGTVIRHHRPRRVMTAQQERETTKIGPAIRIYAPALTELLGGEVL